MTKGKNVGKKNPFYGKTHSVESRKKMSSSQKHRFEDSKEREKISISQRGEKNNNFGGLSEEHKHRISESHMGKKNQWYGKKFSKEHREKIRLGNLGKKVSAIGRIRISLAKMGNKNPMYHIVPEMHPMWRGGKSFEPYGLDFNEELREKIRTRDKYCCRKCGIIQNGRKLAVHHIDYDKENNISSNLISLCLECHLETNFHREYWTDYFKESFEDVLGVKV